MTQARSPIALLPPGAPDDAATGAGHPALAVCVTDLHHGVVHVHLAGELDMLTAPGLLAALAELHGGLPAGHRGTMRLELAALAFLDSAGLTALTHGREALVRHGWTVCLSEPQGQVLRVLELAVMFGWLPRDQGYPDSAPWGQRTPSRLRAVPTPVDAA